MRHRLVAAVTAAIFVLPLTAASAASASTAPRPHHDCPASTDLIPHHCGK
jgi:hypothetical protein